MDNNTKNEKIWALKFSDWVSLLILVFVCAFFIYSGISMNSKQMRQISELNKWIDAGGGEIHKISPFVGKDMILTQNFLILSFIISVSCLIIIITYLLISYFRAKRKMKKKHNQTINSD